MRCISTVLCGKVCAAGCGEERKRGHPHAAIIKKTSEAKVAAAVSFIRAPQPEKMMNDTLAAARGNKGNFLILQ